ncbi:MAG: hypothetical protein M0R66_06830 [Candidatus Omnitrophica bacterium]|jgi:hypothetical protein|nr:hypothetical protein [Candidatus Omnitrophota bacterium]
MVIYCMDGLLGPGARPERRGPIEARELRHLPEIQRAIGHLLVDLDADAGLGKRAAWSVWSMIARAIAKLEARADRRGQVLFLRLPLGPIYGGFRGVIRHPGGGPRSIRILVEGHDLSIGFPWPLWVVMLIADRERGLYFSIKQRGAAGWTIEERLHRVDVVICAAAAAGPHAEASGGPGPEASMTQEAR